jgi:hypothetical protein
MRYILLRTLSSEFKLLAVSQEMIGSCPATMESKIYEDITKELIDSPLSL